LPTFIAENTSASRATNSSCRERVMIRRVSEAQTCPASRHSAAATVVAAWSRSASSRMTAGDLPPSSRVTRPIRSPISDAIRRPASVDPVKAILSTRGSRTNASEASRSAMTTLSTPGGRPTASAHSARTYVDAGASGAALSTVVHPASNAGASLWLDRPSGAFHGTIAPTTPTGSRTIMLNPAPGVVGACSSQA